MDNLGNVESKGISCKSCDVLARSNAQLADTAGGLDVGKTDLDRGAGDQGIMSWPRLQ